MRFAVIRVPACCINMFVLDPDGKECRNLVKNAEK